MPTPTLGAHTMARIPYADENRNDEVKALAARIRKERGKLANLDRKSVV